VKVAKYTVILFGTILVSLSGCTTTNRGVSPESSQLSVRLSEGEYLSSAYIDALKSTRSPLEAGKTGELNRISVQRNGKRLLLTPGYNFHEAGVEFAFQNNGSLSPASPKDAWSENTRNLSATAVDERTLRFGLGDDKPATYIFVKSATDYVSRVVLAGKYRDRQGRVYEFTQDGWAIFPDRKFRFEIGLDHVLDDFDYFLDGTKMWAFKRKGAELQIFPTSNADGPEEISSDRPQLTLREVPQGAKNRRYTHDEL
jgi:hypothetical protein